MEVETRQSWIRSNTREPVVDIACGKSIYYWDDGSHIETEIDYLGMDRYEEPIDTGPDTPDNFIVAAAEHVPLPDDSYKTAVIGEVLEHCENPVLAIEEAHRVASDQVLLTVTDEERWAMDIDFDGDGLEHPRRKYDRQKLLDQCLEAGIDESRISLGHTEDFPLAFHVAKIEV